MSKVNNCPPHHYLCDSDNVGRCMNKNCRAVKDFGELLRKAGVYVAAGQRGAKGRKEALAKKRGRKRKEELLWERDYFSD